MRLEGEVGIQENELDYLKLENRKIQEENTQFNKDLAIKAQTVEEHAKKQFEQNKKIKLLQKKIDLMEESISKITADFDKEKELMKFQNEQLIKEQSEEIRNLNESIALKSHECKNLKAFCQMVLDQRSDIEQFFLESLEQVKEEKRRKIEAEGGFIN